MFKMQNFKTASTCLERGEEMLRLNEEEHGRTWHRSLKPKVASYLWQDSKSIDFLSGLQ